MIPYGRQDIRQPDIDAVVAVLQSDFLTQGPQVPAFEQAVAAYCGAKYAVAVNSATSALHLACLALGLGPGDWLWTSPITFTASANCALYCGAQVDFVDIDPYTLNMSVAALRAKLALAKQQQRLPNVVVPVHLCGQPCDMAAIHALAQEYGFAMCFAIHMLGLNMEVLGLLLGMLRVDYLTYLAGSWLAIAPGMVCLVIAGNSLDLSSPVFWVFLAINTVLVVCSVVYTLRKLRAAKAKGEKQDG